MKKKTKERKGIESIVKEFPFETRRILIGIAVVFVGIMLISGFTGGWKNLTGMVTGNFKPSEKSVSDVSMNKDVTENAVTSDNIVQQCRDACMKSDRNGFCEMQRSLKQVNEKGDVIGEESVTCNMLANEARFSVFGVTKEGCANICEMAGAGGAAMAPPQPESAPPMMTGSVPPLPQNPAPPMAGPESAPPQPAGPPPQPMPPENMMPPEPAPPLP